MKTSREKNVIDKHAKIKEAFQEEYDRKVQRDAEFRENSPRRMA